MKGITDTKVDNAATKLPAPCTPKLEYMSAQKSGKAAPRRLRQTLRIDSALEAYKVYESAKKSANEEVSEPNYERKYQNELERPTKASRVDKEDARIEESNSNSRYNPMNLR